MPILESRLNVRSGIFEKNRREMLELVEEFRAVERKVRATEASKQQKFHDRGQLLPRERVNLLLDRGSPFLELSTLAGYKQHDDKDGSLAGGNSISGIGYVAGTRCLITANNSAIKGGTISPWGLAKGLRCQEIVLQQKLPVLSLVESGGANLMHQAEIFVPGGRTFANQARLSAAGIPQITVVHGSSTAGGAYMPGLSDYVIMVRERAKVFLAGPPLLKAATGEAATDEELGGAEMHANQAGTTEWLAEDDVDGIRLAREAMDKIAWNHDQPPTAGPGSDYRPPRHDPDELAGVVPVDYRKPYDCREVIARLVDDSDFLEFKADFDAQLVCGQASLHGHPVGLVGNNGPITTHGANKAAQFIQLCCQSGISIVFLQNITGYMVGTEPEQGGMVKHGSKMIQAVANATVPRITLVLGGSFGAGNYGMCGRGFDPDFIFAWPNSRTSVMGGDQAARVMNIITREKMERRGEAVDEDFLQSMGDGIRRKFDEESHAFAGTARLWDDGIIDPRDSRRVLGYTLSICREARIRRTHANTFGVARF